MTEMPELARMPGWAVAANTEAAASTTAAPPAATRCQPGVRSIRDTPTGASASTGETR